MATEEFYEELVELLNQETKICPECAETIKLKAKKCRFCGAELDPEQVAREVQARRVKLSEKLDKKRQGKLQCPQCGNWDVRMALTEDGSQGHWCDTCKKSLKAMGVDEPGRPTTTPKPPQETKVVIEQKTSGVWKFVGVLLAILLILIILGSLGI
jgi:predicted RNA-binding Zn-ribbon protein involved in translation (DUF1610 family)